jgi:hypothetical protein
MCKSIRYIVRGHPLEERTIRVKYLKRRFDGDSIWDWVYLEDQMCATAGEANLGCNVIDTEQQSKSILINPRSLHKTKVSDT